MGRLGILGNVTYAGKEVLCKMAEVIKTWEDNGPAILVCPRLTGPHYLPSNILVDSELLERAEIVPSAPICTHVDVDDDGESDAELSLLDRVDWR